MEYIFHREIDAFMVLVAFTGDFIKEGLKGMIG